VSTSSDTNFTVTGTTRSRREDKFAQVIAARFLSLGGAQSVQVERHQFDQRIRALQRAVDDRPAPLGHPPLLIGLEHDEHLGLAPLDSKLPPLVLATDADLLNDSPHPDPATINPDRDPLASEFVARGQIPGTEPEQVAGASRQHLLSQFAGDSPHRFLVQLQAPSSQLAARLLDRQLTDQAAHLGLDVGTRPLADPIRRQFRIEPTSLDATSLAAASPRGTVERHHRDRQAPQKPHHQGAFFFSTGRSGTSASAITLSTWGVVSGCSLALANSPAT